MKRIAYISVPQYADCDAPLLHHLQAFGDVTYFLKVRESSKKLTLLNIEKLKEKGGVFASKNYSGLEELKKHVDITKTYIINMPSKKDFSFQNLRAQKELLRILGKGKYDIVHITSPLSHGEFMLYTLRKKMILTVHDPISHSSSNDLRNKLHRFLAFKLIKRFIILNLSQREEFISKYHLEESIVYNSHLSIYTHLKDTTPKFPFFKDYVLFVGNISSYKGIDILCEAMSKIHPLFPNTKLIIAGRGKIYFDIEKYQNEQFITLENRYLSNEELAGYISKAAFVVCPYIDATQSGVVMSAFALNKPVIGTNVGGLPEMIEHGRHGFIVPPKDIGALAAAIKELLTSHDLLVLMSKNIESDYTQGSFSWKRIAQDYLRIYQKEF